MAAMTISLVNKPIREGVELSSSLYPYEHISVRATAKVKTALVLV